MYTKTFYNTQDKYFAKFIHLHYTHNLMNSINDSLGCILVAVTSFINVKISFDSGLND